MSDNQVSTDASHAPCAKCAQDGQQAATQRFIYALGKLDVRMPTLGLEREFRRCALQQDGKTSPAGARMRKVLAANPHLATRVCYVLSIGGSPAFSLMPTIEAAREALVDGLSHVDSPDHWVLVVGRLGPACRPGDCGGLQVPIVFCDQVFCFSLEEWIDDLQKSIAPGVDAKVKKLIPAAALELFSHAVSSLQNLGANDAQRALNFLLMRHAGLFLAVAERRGKAVLERIVTRVTEGIGARRQVLVILTFLDLATGVPERLCCRVDVTEEWPFLADQTDGRSPVVGLMPYVESELVGAGA